MVSCSVVQILRERLRKAYAPPTLEMDPQYYADIKAPIYAAAYGSSPLQTVFARRETFAIVFIVTGYISLSRLYYIILELMGDLCTGSASVANPIFVDDVVTGSKYGMFAVAMSYFHFVRMQPGQFAHAFVRPWSLLHSLSGLAVWLYGLSVYVSVQRGKELEDMPSWSCPALKEEPDSPIIQSSWRYFVFEFASVIFSVLLLIVWYIWAILDNEFAAFWFYPVTEFFGTLMVTAIIEQFRLDDDYDDVTSAMRVSAFFYRLVFHQSALYIIWVLSLWIRKMRENRKSKRRIADSRVLYAAAWDAVKHDSSSIQALVSSTAEAIQQIPRTRDVSGGRLTYYLKLEDSGPQSGGSNQALLRRLKTSGRGFANRFNRNERLGNAVAGVISASNRPAQVDWTDLNNPTVVRSRFKLYARGEEALPIFARAVCNLVTTQIFVGARVEVQAKDITLSRQKRSSWLLKRWESGVKRDKDGRFRTEREKNLRTHQGSATEMVTVTKYQPYNEERLESAVQRLCSFNGQEAQKLVLRINRDDDEGGSELQTMAAQNVKPQFDDGNGGGGTHSASVIIGALKKVERVYQKVTRSYKGRFELVCDLVRGSIVVQDLATVVRVFEAIKASKAFDIVQIKNRFVDEAGEVGNAHQSVFEYRDLKMLVAGAATGGFVCELQVHLESVQDIKGEYHSDFIRHRDSMGE